MDSKILASLKAKAFEAIISNEPYKLRAYREFLDSLTDEELDYYKMHHYDRLFLLMKEEGLVIVDYDKELIASTVKGWLLYGPHRTAYT